ncbi:hypothetical protein ASPZODRAFT_71134 [Penicilliopsis zonata CBS 506.65]|uniref:Glycosyl hydrolase family 30 beta sandwich domain-containing protein n=1 Tax=Penicilliopsis zonata CBS 506.65 TaxID=1073090 RepID=A0A1L9SC07_9EURO|nr:hypothetical protein ASPZODRAFT_71134 [Penicilliopsis zonata CBS 506.65]OJJ44711.1 hypothetical protein ASPZODRAFT_71134 [Penicilliopsis zonata CBS 506.65]
MKQIPSPRLLLLCLGALTNWALAATPSVSVSVNPSIQFQEVDGFGCSEAFQRAEDVLGKDGLPPVNQTLVLNLLFDQTVGAGFTILRNGIGSSNNSASNLMNSIEPFPPSDSSPSSPPHYVWDGYDSGQFPLAEQAYQRDLQSLYANAWSAPGYMKTNHDENYGGYICGVANTSCSTGDWMQAYANYLIQYVRFYHEAGVKVTHLGFLNEPQYAADYASMLSSGAQAADFIRVLAKTVKESGFELQLTCCDGIGWDDQEAMLPGLHAGPDPAIQYLSVLTGHGYDSPPSYPLSTAHKTWLTEWADLTGDYTPYTFYQDGGQGEGLTWASRIQVAFTQANTSAFLYWIGAENSTTNSPLINLLDGVVVPSKRFYAFAQFSRFVRPGARRVEAASSNPVVTVSAFRNQDGTLATQVINNATSSYEIDVKVDGLETGVSVQPYLTNNEYDLEPLAEIRTTENGTFKGRVPARSMISFVASR